MKKILLIVIVCAIIVSCEAIKNVKPIRNISPVQQELLTGEDLENAYKTYTLQIPKTWYSFKEVHGHIMHAPKVMKKRSDNFYENNFYVTEYAAKVCNATSIEGLFEFYHNKMRRLYPNVAFVPQTFQHKEYGKYYLIKYGTSWSKKMLFTKIDVLFNYKNRNFILNYTSENKYYDEFIKEVEQIINSFKIKEAI
jgi:hypothetical protein